MGMFGRFQQGLSNAFSGDNIAMTQALLAGDYGAVGQIRAQGQARQQQEAALRLRQEEALREQGQIGDQQWGAGELGYSKPEILASTSADLSQMVRERRAPYSLSPNEQRVTPGIGGAADTRYTAPSADELQLGLLDRRDPSGNLGRIATRRMAFPPIMAPEGGSVFGINDNNQIDYLIPPASMGPQPSAPGPQAAASPGISARRLAGAPRAANRARFNIGGGFTAGDGYGAPRPGGGIHHGLDTHGRNGAPFPLAQNAQVLGSHRQQRIRTPGRDGGNIARVRIGDAEWLAMHLPNLPTPQNPVIRAGLSGISSGNAEVHWQPANPAARAIYARGREATIAHLTGRQAPQGRGVETAQANGRTYYKVRGQWYDNPEGR